MVDYTRPPSELIVDLVNVTNSISIPYVAVTVKSPGLNPDPVTKPREMKTDIVAIDGLGYLDQKTVYYNRKKIGALLGDDIIIPMPIGFDESTKFDELIEKINAESNGKWLLDPNDFDSAQRLIFTTGQKATLTLIAKDTSQIIGGTTDVLFVREATSLPDVIGQNVLDGF